MGELLVDGGESVGSVLYNVDDRTDASGCRWVVAFVSVGFTVCAVATFAPLGRKRTEIAAQTANRSAAVVDASHDPLDRAANDRTIPGDIT